MKTTFQIVSSVFQTASSMLAGAIACASVYNRSQGQPDASFPVADETGAVTLDFKLNCPGVVAADSAANIVAIMRFGLDKRGNIDPSQYLEAMTAIKDWDLSDDEAIAACNVANATWRSCLFAARNEDRWKRPVNVSFNELPGDEKTKDKDQLRAAAEFWLNQISNSTN